MSAPLPTGSSTAHRPFGSVWIPWLEHGPSEMQASAIGLFVDASMTCPQSLPNPAGTNDGQLANPGPVPDPAPGTTLWPSVGNASNAGSVVGIAVGFGCGSGCGCGSTGTIALTASTTRPRLCSATGTVVSVGTVAAARLPPPF